MHATADELEAAANGREPENIADHLARCATCQDAMTRLRVEQALQDPLTWALAEQPFDIETLREHVTMPLQEADVLLRLRHAHAALFSDPSHALATAESVLADLSQSALHDTAHLRVLALRERANALFRLGRFDETLATLDDAARLASTLPVSEYELAVLAYIRASVLAERGDYRPSIAMAQDARRTLELFGDEERALYARLLEAVALYESGDQEAALGAHERILQRESSLTGVQRATLCQNWAACLVAVGRVHDAEAPLREAEEYYERSEMHVETTRVRWARALVAARLNQHETSAKLLHDVAAAFDRLEMRYEAATARVDLIDQLVLTENVTTVPHLARDVAAVFSTTQSRPQLAEALAILQRAETAHADASEAIAAVRRTLPFGHPLDDLFA